MIRNPVSSSCFAIGKLRSDHFANDDCARIDQILNGLRGVVGRRVQPVPGPIAIGSAQSLDIIDIFDTDSNTGQWLLSGLFEVETRWHSNSVVLTKSPGRKHGIGTISVGDCRFGEGTCYIAVQPPCLVDMTSCADEVRTGLQAARHYAGDDCGRGIACSTTAYIESWV